MKTFVTTPSRVPGRQPRAAHPKRTRAYPRATVATLVAASLAAAACASSNDTTAVAEDTAAAASALDPNGVIPVTTYKFQLGLHVYAASQPSGPGHYVEFAGLAVQVNGLEPDPAACSYGAGLPGLLPNCVSGPTAGTPLEKTPTVTSSSDTVTVGMSLDNIETVSVTTANNAFAGALGEAGNIAQTGGAALSVLLPPPYDGIGVLTSFIGSGLAAVGSILGAQPNGGPQGTCVGGLVQNPTSAGGLPRDFVYETFTAAQLQTLTANGPITIPYGASTEYPTAGGTCWSDQELELTISRVWTTGSGPAAFAKSPDSAVVGQAGGIDHFSVVTSPAAGVVHEFLPPGGSWSSELVTTGGLADGAPTLRTTSSTIAALSRTPTSFDLFFVDDLGLPWWAYSRSPGVWSTTALVPANLMAVPTGNGRITAVAPTPETLDVFWVGNNGAVQEWSVTDPSVYGSSPPAAAVVPTNTTITPTQITPVGLAPPGAGLAVVAPTPTSVALFFAGKDSLTAGAGALWTSAFNGTSWNTYELAYTSGKIAVGASLTAAAQSEANIDVFFAGTDGGIWNSSWYWGAPNFAGAPISNGQPAYATSELPGTQGLAASAQGLSVVSPAPSERPSSNSVVPGALQVAWVQPSNVHLSNVYVAAQVAGSWGTGPTAVATSATVPVGANPNVPAAIVAPSSGSLDVLFRGFEGGLYDAMWNYPAPSYTVSAQLPEWKWQGWDNLQGGLVSDPALVTPNASELLTAATGPDGTIWWTTYSGSAWSGYRSLGNKGNPLKDGPAMAMDGNKIEIFVRDPVTTHLLHQEGTCSVLCTAPTWNAAGWEDLGGTLTAGTPSVVVSQPGNQIDVVATWTDGSAHIITGQGYGTMGPIYVWNGPVGGVGVWEFEGYDGWSNLSGGIVGEPSIVSWGSDRLDVFVRGGNNQLYTRYSNDNGVTWNPSGTNWMDLGGSVYTSPTAVSWGPNRLDVFVGNSAGAVSHEAWNGNVWSWDSVPGIAMASGARPAAIARASGQIDLFVQNTNSSLFTTTMAGSGTPTLWTSWAEMTPCFRLAGSPSLVSRDGVNLDLVMTSYASNGNASLWHDSTTGTFAEQDQFVPPDCH